MWYKMKGTGVQSALIRPHVLYFLQHMMPAERSVCAAYVTLMLCGLLFYSAHVSMFEQKGWLWWLYSHSNLSFPVLTLTVSLRVSKCAVLPRALWNLLFFPQFNFLPNSMLFVLIFWIQFWWFNYISIKKMSNWSNNTNKIVIKLHC